MSWLRELMANAEPPVGSYGELARACLAHPQWPAPVQPKPRSLASLFSKFDRGIELEWLADRDGVQRVLAQVLGCSRTALRGPMAEHLHTAEVHQQRWRLPDAPFARLLDLKEDPLPPGIPARVQVPAAWGRLWWQTEPGGGVELTRRWLAARGLAKTRVSRDWNEVLADLSSPEPLFIELQSSSPAPPLALSVREAPTCIAAPAPQPALHGFERVSSPPLQTVLGPLLEWVEPLFPKDGRFNVATALKWMAGPVAAQLVDSLQTALGLAGVLDELGLEWVETQRIEQVAQQWLRQRLTAVEPHSGDWLAEQGWSILLGLAQRALTDDELPLSVGRSQQEWRKLIPPEFQRSVDAEWARASLARAGTPLTNEQLQQVLSRTPPGAFRIIHGLQAAGILQPTDEERSQLAPRWLLTTLERQATLALLAGAPSEWGEALLRRAAHPKVRTALRAQFAAGHTEPIEELLELPLDEAPGFVVAVEAALEALGNAWLAGLEVDDEVAGALMALARRYWLDLDETASDPRARSPVPRLLCGRSDTVEFGAWLLAWWALKHCVGEDGFHEHPPFESADLDTDTVDPQGTLRAQLDAISAYLSTLDATDPRIVRSYQLLSRRAGSEMASVHPLLAPLRIVSSADDWSAWLNLRHAPHGLVAVQHLTRDFEDCARRAWRAWKQTAFSAEGAACFENTPQLWAALPADVLGAMLEARQPLIWDEAERYLQPRHFQLLLELQPLPHPWVLRLSLTALPAELVSGWTLILAQAGHRLGLAQLWHNHEPLMLMETLMVLDTAETVLAESLLNSSPSSVATQLLAAIRDRLQHTGVGHPLTPVWRLWLHEQVTQRRPSWRDSYEVLAEIEQRLKRVRSARGSRPN